MNAMQEAEWIQARTERLEAAQMALENGLRNLETSDDWRRMLEAIAVVGPVSVARFSFRNCLLIQSERIGTAHAASFAHWKRLGRQVKRGEHGITILQPVMSAKRQARDSNEDDDAGMARRLVGFKPATVFALEQTEGTELPPILPPDLNSPEAFDGSVDRLRQTALALPGRPVESIALRERRQGDHASAGGWYVPSTREIVVITDARGPAMQFKTLCHEIAHALLHGAENHHSAPEREVEAESVAFIVCHALGVDTSSISFPYVGSWARGEDPLAMIAKSGQRILSAANRILGPLVPGVSAGSDAELVAA
jgi:antirestriction protein ArdC